MTKKIRHKIIKELLLVFLFIELATIGYAYYQVLSMCLSAGIDSSFRFGLFLTSMILNLPLVILALGFLSLYGEIIKTEKLFGKRFARTIILVILQPVSMFFLMILFLYLFYKFRFNLFGFNKFELTLLWIATYPWYLVVAYKFVRGEYKKWIF